MWKKRGEATGFYFVGETGKWGSERPVPGSVPGMAEARGGPVTAGFNNGGRVNFQMLFLFLHRARFLLDLSTGFLAFLKIFQLGFNSSIPRVEGAFSNR
jgi:hypothetical protein